MGYGRLVPTDDGYFLATISADWFWPNIDTFKMDADINVLWTRKCESAMIWPSPQALHVVALPGSGSVVA